MESSVSTIDRAQLHLSILPSATQKAFLEFIKLGWLRRSRWYLAGGTALALQVGHRQSVDLDFFSPVKTFRSLELERALQGTGHWQTSYQEAGTIYGSFWKAKVSFIAYPFFIPTARRLRCGSVKMLLPEDIAVMKIIAISQRGRKRDFYDLFWYCTNREPLGGVIERAITQYPGQQENITHILKSLVYFADAESDPQPQLLFSASWRAVKDFFRKEAVAAGKKLLRW